MRHEWFHRELGLKRIAMAGHNEHERSVAPLPQPEQLSHHRWSKEGSKEARRREPRRADTPHKEDRPTPLLFDPEATLNMIISLAHDASTRHQEAHGSEEVGSSAGDRQVASGVSAAGAWAEAASASSGLASMDLVTATRGIAHGAFDDELEEKQIETLREFCLGPHPFATSFALALIRTRTFSFALRD
jgi:hypothetical protein